MHNYLEYASRLLFFCSVTVVAGSKSTRLNCPSDRVSVSVALITRQYQFSRQGVCISSDWVLIIISSSDRVSISVLLTGVNNYQFL